MISEDEFVSFLRAKAPHYNERMVTVPGESFQYKLPGNQHGIPSQAKEIRLFKKAEEKKVPVGSERKASQSEADCLRDGKQMKKKKEKTESDHIHDWEKAASGQFAEQKVYDMLKKRFSREPCLLVHEFKENDLVKVIKENIDHEKKENLKNDNLIQRELNFFKITNRHFVELEKQITKMMETVTQDRFSEESKPALSKKIEEHTPGFDQLTESNKKNYMKNIESFLEKKFKDGAQYTKSKLKDAILGYFLNLTYTNSEYDLLLFLKVCKISIHTFTKIFYPFKNSGKFKVYPI